MIRMCTAPAQHLPELSISIERDKETHTPLYLLHFSVHFHILSYIFHSFQYTVTTAHNKHMKSPIARCSLEQRTAKQEAISTLANCIQRTGLKQRLHCSLLLQDLFGCVFGTRQQRDLRKDLMGQSAPKNKEKENKHRQKEWEETERRDVMGEIRGFLLLFNFLQSMRLDSGQFGHIWNSVSSLSTHHYNHTQPLTHMLTKGVGLTHTGCMQWVWGPHLLGVYV